MDTEEDWKLIAYVTEHGHKNWRQLPKLAGNRSASVNYNLQVFIASGMNTKVHKFSHQYEMYKLRVYSSLNCCF